MFENLLIPHFYSDLDLSRPQEKNIKKEQVGQVNPPKYEKCEDMSNLTYLNDASVLHNLKQRYFIKLIYVSTGGCGFDSAPGFFYRCFRLHTYNYLLMESSFALS